MRSNCGTAEGCVALCSHDPIHCKHCRHETIWIAVTLSASARLPVPICPSGTPTTKRTGVIKFDVVHWRGECHDVQ